MLINVIIGTSLFVLCVGDSSDSAVSSVSFHRKDVPLSYEYNLVHTHNHEIIKKNVNDNNQKNNYKPQLYGNIQYAPLVSNGNEQNKLRSLTDAAHAQEDLNVPSIEVTTNRNIEPHIPEDLNNNRNLPIQYIAGHNINVEPQTNKISNNNEVKEIYGNNYAFPDVKTHFSGRNNIQSYPYDVSGVNIKGLTPFTQFTTAAEINEAQNPHNSFEQYRQKPRKYENFQVLSALETAKIQPVFNPYVKNPRIHLNIARAYNIASDQYKAPKLLVSFPKQKLVPDVSKNIF